MLLQIFISTLLLQIVIADVICNEALYGNPSHAACTDLLLHHYVTGQRGIESLDRQNHFFSALDSPQARPAHVSLWQWRNRVRLPRVWSLGELKPPLDSTLELRLTLAMSIR